MREWVLLEFLAGRIGVTLLRRDLRGEDPGPLPVAFPPTDLELELLPRHLLRLCDAVLDRELDAAWLGPIAARLRASARFRRRAGDPDGRVVQEVLEAWASAAPGPLDFQAVPVYRRWVVTRRNPFSST
jgi:hypothetical protein